MLTYVCMLFSTRSPEFVDAAALTTPSADMPPDLQLPFAVCNDALWYSAYVAERECREKMEKTADGSCSTAKTPTRRPSHSSASKSASQNVTSRPPNEVVIDNLILLLRARGIPDSDIRDAVLQGKNGILSTSKSEIKLANTECSPGAAVDVDECDHEDAVVDTQPEADIDSDQEGEEICRASIANGDEAPFHRKKGGVEEQETDVRPSPTSSPVDFPAGVSDDAHSPPLIDGYQEASNSYAGGDLETVWSI